jgi:hypothetical protein
MEAKLEQAIEDERKKSEQAMEAKLEQAIEDERKRSEQGMEAERKRWEQEMEAERKRSEQEMEEIRKTMNAENAKLAAESRRLESELDAVKETANDTAEWIATGACLSAHFFSSFLYSLYSSVLTTVRSSAESSSGICLTVFKPSSLFTSVSPPSLILAFLNTHQQQQKPPANEHLQAQTAHSMNHLTPHEVPNVRPAAAAHMTTAQNQDHNQDASALWSSVTTMTNSSDTNSNIGRERNGNVNVDVNDVPQGLEHFYCQ